MAYLLLYVDDIILATSSHKLRAGIISQLQTKFPMTNLGHLSYFLGITVTHTPSYLLVSQEKYAREVLERAGLGPCKPAATPIDTKSKLSADASPPFRDPTLYRSLAGALRCQFADIFTKGLPQDLFLDFRSSLSVRPPPAMTAGV
ncbi:uncharacterized protein LOC110729945 [Chenopodium quinoa]|uniref:uncharacterized protein LOC110729944 n=1 Tax=Chenopodium quinoa TaxID=63459 RepID=UPI000B7996BD|nr:uncharacterized protein LOC110729944 [Chenopodium quinoa]XP_021765430.1 uncharacterized protein LOC110729945 [Chenopodium quinoa]